jgi:hypothetical protein
VQRWLGGKWFVPASEIWQRQFQSLARRWW